MRKLLVSIGFFIFAIVIFVAGFYSGSEFADYDVLCEKHYSAHHLRKEFRSEAGITLPEGTVVNLRGCKPNTSVRLEFYIDNWDYVHTNKLPDNSLPVYYFNTEEGARD